jgi:hypothetical protein
VQPHGKAVKNSAVLPAEDVANAGQTEQEVSANEGYGATNSETPGLTSKLVTGGGPWPQAKIAGKWRDSDSWAVSQITQDGNTFRFARWGTLTNGTRFQSSGRGTISGQRFTSTYYAQYQTGEDVGRVFGLHIRRWNAYSTGMQQFSLWRVRRRCES